MKEMMKICSDRSDTTVTVAYRSTSSESEPLLTFYLRSNIIPLLDDNTELIGTDKI
jgi:hypothetical protein